MMNYDWNLDVKFAVCCVDQLICFYLITDKNDDLFEIPNRFIIDLF